MGDHGDLGVDRGEGGPGAVDLGHADAGGGVDDLALQVREVDHVVVDDADGADPGGGQIHRYRRAEAAGADHQHPRAEQPRLSGAADLAEQDVAGVAMNLVVGEGRDRGGGCFGAGVAHSSPIPSNSAVDR